MLASGQRPPLDSTSGRRGRLAALTVVRSRGKTIEATKFPLALEKTSVIIHAFDTRGEEQFGTEGRNPSVNLSKSEIIRARTGRSSS